MLAKLPDEISALAIEMEREGLTWSYAELADGRFQHWNDLTVGDLEQLVPLYVDRARKAIESYVKNPSRKKAKRAAEFIDRARLYRGKYRLLTNQDHNELDMPFPIMTEAEAVDAARGKGE